MLKIDWTDLLSDTINREWRQFVESLQVVNDININRCIVVEQPEMIELHGFSDASQSAYGAVVYCKSITSDGRMLVHLIASKSRVVPTKQTTIPRLELCAAVLLAKLVHRVKQALKLNVTNTFLWSDSVIVLSWIRKESYQLKTFVANRIATIQEMTSSEQWRYVATEDNPADFVSRGMDTLKLKTCELWWNGPKFLMSNQYPQRQIPVAVIKDPAVHLDIVTDLTSNAFIATLKRFIFRRGKCAKLYSDNATNFVGANIELKKMFNLVCKPDEALASYMASEGIDWKFLPPRAPNFGGLWEAGVKSFKFYLKRVVGNIRLTYEEFLTVIIQIEGMLNSRPLVPLSSDLEDLNVLTPSHFLIGRSITSIVEPDLTNLNENRLDNWQKITKIIQLIWKRWSVDYLNSLQQRNKWHFEKKNAKIGDMVIIKEDNLPSCQWSLGRINNIYPEKDSKVRVVEVKTTRVGAIHKNNYEGFDVKWNEKGQRVERVTVGSTSACRTILRFSFLVVFLVAPDPVFHLWVPSRVHCSQQFLTAHSERSTWPVARRVDQPAVFFPMIRPLSNSLNCEKCLLAHLPGMFRLPKFSYNRRTDHQIGTSAHAPQRPMVPYTGMGNVGPDPHGLLHHRV
ncbi:integrase catalytic domain-containing protein [Trichonephila clavipes]|nr:integrase catalytic domain-containing protein [Trichonephila clavipes]